MSETHESPASVISEPTVTPVDEATANPATDATEGTSPETQVITGEELMQWANKLRMEAYLTGRSHGLESGALIGSQEGFEEAHRRFCKTCQPDETTAEDAPASADEQDTELSVFEKTVYALSDAIDYLTAGSVLVLGAGATAATIAMCAEQLRGGDGSKTRGVLSTFGSKLLDNLYPLKSSA